MSAQSLKKWLRYRLYRISVVGVGYTNAKEFEFQTSLHCPDLIFDFDTTMKLTAVDNIEFRIQCEVPALRKSLGAEFVFKPRSLQDFEFFVTLILENQKFGGGAAFQFDGRKVDAQISVYTPIINGDYKMGGEFSSTSSSSVLSLYFNKAIWSLEFDAISGNFSAKSNFNLSQFVHSIIGSLANVSIPMIKEVEFELDYKYLQSIKILASVEERGKLEFGFSAVRNRFLGNLELTIIPLEVAKAANFAFEFSRNGQMEFSIRDNKDKIEFEIVGDDPGVYKTRNIRAAVYSSEFGNTEFEFSKAKSRGVFVLTTKKGIHKVSYDIRRNGGYDITVNMESPYLNNGMASTKFSVDLENNVYDCRLSLNNDHFVSAYFNKKLNGVDTELSFESTLLPEKIVVKASYNWDGKIFSSDCSVTYISKHSCSIKIDIFGCSASAHVTSIYIPFQRMGLNLSFKRTISNNNELSLLLDYGEENVQVVLTINIHSVLDFSGSLRTIASQFILSKTKLDFEFNFDTKKHFGLELQTSNPKLSRASVLINVDHSDGYNEVQAIMKLPIVGFEHYEMKITTEENLMENILSNQFEVHLHTPKSQYFVVQNWSFKQNKLFFITKIDCPYGIRYHLISSVDWDSRVKILVDAKLPFVDEVELTLVSTEIWKSYNNVVTISLEFKKHFMETYLTYNILGGFEFILTCQTSFPQFKNQRIAVGFENTERKMLKAHIEIFGERNGLELEYIFTDLKTMACLLKLDFPFHGWTDIYFDFANIISPESGQMNFRAGAGINELRAGLHFYKHAKMTIIDVFVKENYARGILENDQSILVRISGHKQDSTTRMKFYNILQEDMHILTKFGLITDGEWRIFYQKLSPMKMGKFMIKNLYFPVYFSSSLTLDNINQVRNEPLHSVEAALEICSNTADCDNSSMAIDFALRKYKNSGDLSLTSHLPGKPSFTARTSILHSATISANSFELFLGSEKKG